MLGGAKVLPIISNSKIVDTPTIFYIGDGYTNSEYFSDKVGQWYYNDMPISGVYGRSFVMKNFLVGKSIRCENSNEIKMWSASDLLNGRIGYCSEGYDPNH